MRLIDADALDEVVLDLNANRDFGITRSEYKLIDSVLFEFPTIEERKKGKWKLTGFGYGFVRAYGCSECDAVTVNRKFRYCPWCGVKMEGEEDA